MRSIIAICLLSILWTVFAVAYQAGYSDGLELARQLEGERP